MRISRIAYAMFMACCLIACAASAKGKLPIVDLSAEANRHVVIAAGTKNVYQGHPTTVMTEDGRVIAVWCTPHGGWCGPAAETADGGKTWKRIDKRFPKGFRRHVNCPSVYRLVGPDGKARIWVWSQVKMPSGIDNVLGVEGLEVKRLHGAPMPSVMSEDEGLTWKEMPPLGEKFRCVMAFSSVVRLKDGSYLGMFHVRSDGRDAPPLMVWQTITKDGGFTWSDPVCVASVKGKSVCEPYVFRSPKGDELCCIMRENTRTGFSMMMFSRDEGKTWSKPEETPMGLTGDRHQGVQLPDGRVVIVFRNHPLGGHFGAWVGPYEAIKSRAVEGTYMIKLLHNYSGNGDCGYPGIHLLPDGTILTTTYCKYWNDDRQQSVVSTRFHIDETDRRLETARRTQWFREAAFGIMVHYLADSEVSMTRADDIHSSGVKRDWNACIDAFDVERFADEMKRAGAGYVMFSLLQCSRFVAAPNAEYDAWFGLKPGEACANRDLPMELADALAKRGIPLMLYFTGDGPNLDSKLRTRGGFATPIPDAWVDRWAKVLECFSVRYGRKVKGWWIDGCYVKLGNYGYTPEKLRKYERAIRKGNPDAIIAFNRAEDIPKTVVDPYVPFQDYTAGEKNDFVLPHSGRFVEGQQWHTLTFLGEYWGRPGLRLDPKSLAEYLYLANRAGGTVTLDVMCYWDGGLERSHIDALSGVRSAIARMKAKAVKNGGNLAFMRPAKCLSLRGAPLPMQKKGRKWKSFLAATDGEIGTYIRGCDEWPWLLEVDLGHDSRFSKVSVRYAQNSYATRVRLSVSSDGKTWRTVAEKDNADKVQTMLTFQPVSARYVRYAALKPNGPGQPGGQMGVAEFEVR